MNEKKIRNEKKISKKKIYRKIETIYQNIKHHWKEYIIKSIILFMIILFIIYIDVNIDKIQFVYDLNKKLYIPLLNNLLGMRVNLIYILAYILLSIPIIVACRLLFKPISYEEYNNALENALKPKESEEKIEFIAPQFITEYSNPLDKDTKTLMYYRNNVTHEDFNKNRELIQNNLNNEYVKCFKKYGSNKELIYITKQDPFNPKTIYWNNKFILNDKDSLKIILGKRFDGEYEIWDMQKDCHGKICGETRSGKTYLQKVINSQFLLQGNQLYVYDGKKIDYQGIWQRIKNCTVVNTEIGLLNSLKILENEHEKRTQLLNNKIDTIDKYNKDNPDKKKNHIMLVIEEAADIFGKDFTMYNADTKELKERIANEKSINSETIRLIEKLIRKAGATGIHVILNSQKLTATMLPKQLPLNLTKNYSLHVDTITSQIAVGNDDAHDLIPKGVKGIFVDEEHNLVQGYYIADEKALMELDSGIIIDGDLKVAKIVESMNE